MKGLYTEAISQICPVVTITYAYGQARREVSVDPGKLFDFGPSSEQNGPFWTSQMAPFGPLYALDTGNFPPSSPSLSGPARPYKSVIKPLPLQDPVLYQHIIITFSIPMDTIQGRQVLR